MISYINFVKNLATPGKSNFICLIKLKQRINKVQFKRNIA